MIQAVIFDLDGTLVDTEDLNARAYLNIIRRLGGDGINEREFMVLYRQQVGQTDEYTARILVGQLGLEESCRRLQPQYNLSQPWQVFSALRVTEYGKFISDHQVLKEHRRPQVIGLLRQVRAEGYATALATSSLTGEARQVLQGLDLADQFDQIIGADQVRNPKPDPEIYLLAAQKLGVPPEDCLVLEDSTNGVRAGVAAGMNVVAVATPFTNCGLHTSQVLDHAWVVHEPEQLLEVVRQRVAEHNRTAH